MDMAGGIDAAHLAIGNMIHASIIVTVTCGAGVSRLRFTPGPDNGRRTSTRPNSHNETGRLNLRRDVTKSPILHNPLHIHSVTFCYIGWL